MNKAQEIYNSLCTTTVKLKTRLLVNWVDGSSQEIAGSDIIDAFNNAKIPLDRMVDMVNWEFVKAPKSAESYLRDLSSVDESQIFEIRLDQMQQHDFDGVNGILPANLAPTSDNYKTIPLVTIPEQLTAWGWKDEYKAILVTAFKTEKYHNKFLMGLLHLDIPVVLDIKDDSNLPKPVLTRQFKIIE